MSTALAGRSTRARRSSMQTAFSSGSGRRGQPSVGKESASGWIVGGVQRQRSRSVCVCAGLACPLKRNTVEAAGVQFPDVHTDDAGEKGTWSVRGRRWPGWRSPWRRLLPPLPPPRPRPRAPSPRGWPRGSRRRRRRPRLLPRGFWRLPWSAVGGGAAACAVWH